MVTRLPLDQPDIVTGPVITRDPRVLAVARDDPLAQRETVSLEDLADRQVLAITDIAPRELADAYVPKRTPSGRTIKRLHAPVQNLSDLVILIARGKVVQPTVAAAAPRFAHSNVACIPISDMPPASTALAWRRRASDPRLHALINIARELEQGPSA
jgi:hypothetical protein